MGKIGKIVTRQCLVQDDSGHWYCINVSEKEDFEAWVESFEDSLSEENYDGPDFEDKRIDGVHTFSFTDGKEG